MSAKNSKVNLSLERPLYNNIEYLAKRDGVSLSIKLRDLIKEALELEEDVSLAIFAEKREKTFRKTKSLKHDEVW